MFFDAQVFGIIFNFRKRDMLDAVKTAIVPSISSFETGTCVYVYKKDVWKIPANMAEVIADLSSYNHGPLDLLKAMKETLEFMSNSDVDSDRNFFVFTDHFDLHPNALQRCVLYDRERGLNFKFHWCLFNPSLDFSPLKDLENCYVHIFENPQDAADLIKRIYDERK